VVGVRKKQGRGRRPEASLKDREEQYRLLFTQMQQAVSVHEIVLDESGQVIDYIFVDVNTSFERVFSLRLPDVRGKSIREVNPAVSDAMVQALGRVALTGEPYFQEYYSVRANRTFSIVSYSPQRGRFASIHTDITERKQAEAALMQKNKILEAINRYGLAQADCNSYEALAALITVQLAENATTPIAILSEYDAVKKALVVRHMHMDQTLRNLGRQLFGEEIFSIEVAMSDAEHARLAAEPTTYRWSLTAMTGGIITEEVSNAVKEAAGIECFLVVALVVEAELYATLVIGLKDQEHTPHADFLKPFAHLSSISLRRIHAEEKLRHMSFHDQLTGLYNRHFLAEEMNRLDTARQLPLSIIMADLNGLKMVNDTYGHAHGDEMLRAAATAIKSCCRKEDIVARWGGDEFVVLLPRTVAATTEQIGKRIAAQCRTSYVGDVPVSVSLGTAIKTSVSQNLKQVLREAEDTMYKNKLSESSSTRSSVLHALIKALDEKSFETQTHTMRMQAIATKIGERIRLPVSELARLMLVIRLHDIGKINIPEEILKRSGPLSMDEWRIMKTHPEVGSRIARATEEFAHVANDILSHHERWDGTGYPQGLAGTAIPLLARITTIVDAYEVMTNGRPYKAALSHAAVVAELKACSGSQFDPEIVQVMLGILASENC